MSNLYRLVGVGNAELVAGLSKLVQQSNGLTAQVLAHLVELDERRLHLDLGFSSLFAYCVESLGMSEGAAGRRVTAARVCRRFPDAFERVARGELHLCALCALTPHLNQQNATELFEACKDKTRRQIEQLLAVRFPRQDVREQIRRLPARGSALTRLVMFERANGSVAQFLLPARPFDAHDAPLDSGISLAGHERSVGERAPNAQPETLVITANSRMGERIPTDRGRVESTVAKARPRPRSREIEPLSADRFGVHFTADAELRDLIERARELASHSIPKGDLAALMKLMVGRFVKQEEKRRFGIGVRPRRGDSVAANSAHSEPITSPGGASVSSGRSKGGIRMAQQTSLEPRHQTKLARPSKAAVRPHGAAASSTLAPPDGGVGNSEPSAPPGGASVSSGSPTVTACGTSFAPGPHSRYVPMQIRREIHARDGGRCAYVARDGRRCSARGFIQFDHLKPFAWRGASDALNLRLLCKAHNLLHARKYFGALH